MPPGCRIGKSKVNINGEDKSIGNGVFASRDFSAGEAILLLDRPLVGSLDTERLEDTCADCYVWTQGADTGASLYVPEGTKVSKCAGCQRFRYCSKACQKNAWNRGHKHECKALRSVVGKDIPKAVLACTGLLSRRRDGLISDEQWDILLPLQTHIDDFKRNGTYGNIELMAMGASQLSFTQNMFNKDFVAAMYARVLTNSLTLITPSLDPLGIILDPFLGNINHSCDPNVFVMMDGPESSLRSLKPIKKDEEIYISYIDTSNPYHRRQSELKSRWFFTCHCSKCQHGATLDEDKWANSPERMTGTISDVADTILKTESFHEDPVNFVGDSLAEKRVAAVQGKAFEEYQNAQALHPEDAVEALQGAMQLCDQSKLWPVYRQPYAALRDDLIVNLLSKGDYVTAWSHSAKRYKYIDPKLYPVPFHPVRVVHNWQMAMVAAYLASIPKGIEAPGVNMGLIAMMLVKQVLDAASASHGIESAFTKSVRAKSEEMTDALQRGLGGNVNTQAINRELEVQRDMLNEMANWAKL